MKLFAQCFGFRCLTRTLCFLVPIIGCSDLLNIVEFSSKCPLSMVILNPAESDRIHIFISFMVHAAGLHPLSFPQKPCRMHIALDAYLERQTQRLFSSGSQFLVFLEY